jgi:hypothetical protein
VTGLASHAGLEPGLGSNAATELDRVDQAIPMPYLHDHRAGIRVDRNSLRCPLQPQPDLDLLTKVREGVASAGASAGNLNATLGIPTLDDLGTVGGHPHNTRRHGLGSLKIGRSAGPSAISTDRDRARHGVLTARRPQP